MNLKDITSEAWHILKTVAPTIADTAAGPFAPLVDPIVHAIFGTSDAKQVETALLNATPDQLLALKQADNAHAEKLVQLGIDRDKLAFDDVASARDMQKTVKDPVVTRLAVAIVIGFFVFCGGEAVAMIVWPEKWAALSQGAVGMLGTILGYLAAESKQVTAFLYGSSVGSQAKDDTIAQIAKQ